MKVLTQRLLLFFIGLPAIVAIVLFLPQYNHLAVNVLTLLVSALGSMEFASMLRKRSLSISNLEALILGSICPAAVLITVCFSSYSGLASASIMAGAAWLLISRVFNPKKVFEDSLNQMAAGFSVIIYPGLFMVWLMRMTQLDQAEFIILTFLLLVIANDSAGWAVGMLFGKGNQGIIAASPNKSAAGFAGGLVVSVAVGIGAVRLAPQVFSPTRLSAIPAGVILGLVCAITSSLGDLAESVMKRSAAVKDSGTIIPGRGGILDSIDSIALTAPVFYGLYRLLFG